MTDLHGGTATPPQCKCGHEVDRHGNYGCLFVIQYCPCTEHTGESPTGAEPSRARCVQTVNRYGEPLQWTSVFPNCEAEPAFHDIKDFQRGPCAADFECLHHEYLPEPSTDDVARLRAENARLTAQIAALEAALPEPIASWGKDLTVSPPKDLLIIAGLPSGFCDDAEEINVITVEKGGAK